ncbi:hypothetical protein RN001_004837 [Aquatica leii]|uniref:Cadherin-related family member 1 n=1 Tax=Aquatica leii TaxID=1421715 RepID=A0AAN7SPN8_9COLE|nr:hypothetical protein RN001_004837 [Aquatica leii]
MWWILFFTVPLMVLSYPRFDPTATMQNVLVPSDAPVSSVIYRLRATDTGFDFPLSFDLEGDSTIVSLETLNCSRFNSVCQANVILQKKLESGRFYDFIVALRNPRGMTVRMRCSFRATNATTPMAEIFPGAPSLIKISELAKRNSELGTLIARGNPRREKAVFVELWGSPLFGLRQRLINEKDAEAAVILIGSLDYETQRSHHLTILANDAWTEPGNDSRNIASWPLLIAVLDEQDTPPVFTVAPPVTVLDPNIKPGDYILRVHAEDGDRGNPRMIRYGLVSEGNPFTAFFNLSEDTGILRLAKPISEIQAISHAGAPVILTVVAEEIRVGANEPPALSTSVQIALLPPLPSGTLPHFSTRLISTSLDENSPPGTRLKVPNVELIGEPGEIFSLQLINNNGTFDVSPAIIEGRGKFVIIVRDSTLLDYEQRHMVQCILVAKQLGRENNTVSLPIIVMLNDVNDLPPRFHQTEWHASILESAEVGTSVLRVTAIDPDTMSSDHIRYTRLLGVHNNLFKLHPVSGLIIVDGELDAETVAKFQFIVEAADEDGNGLKANATVFIELIDVNDQIPKFEKKIYEFILNKNRKQFTFPAFIKAIDLDVSPPNNIVHYELVTAIENVTLDKDTGELKIRSEWKGDDIAVLKARAWDGGVPRLSSECEIRLYPPDSQTKRIIFIVPGHNPDRKYVEDTLKALTKSKVIIHDIRPYKENGEQLPLRSEVEATVLYGPNTVIDIGEIEAAYRDKERQETREAGLAWPWWILIILLILLLLLIIILIICCICSACPLYMPPRKRKVGSAEDSKLIIQGSGHGVSSKSVQVAEWFGRREAWTPDPGLVENEADSLRRHEYERGSDRGGHKRVIHKSQFTKDDPREHLYIREGNADILRLITRGGEQQRPPTLVDQSVEPDNGKEILMRRFIDQQQMTAAPQPVNLPNEINRNNIEHEQLEATLREQNNLLKQILLEREREVRLETQSLPAGTQTDRDAFTQTEPRYLRPPQRLIRSDNDASDVSDDEVLRSKKRNAKHTSLRRRDANQVKRKIRTPIQEESESNVETTDVNDSSSKRTLEKLRMQVIQELLNQSTSNSRQTRSAIRKEVLREIAASLVNSEDNLSDSELYSKEIQKKLYNNYSDDSLDHVSVGVEANKRTIPNETHQRYHSENDLRNITNLETIEKVRDVKSVSQSDLLRRSSSKASQRKSDNLKPRYMEWYTKMHHNSAKSQNKEETIPPKPGTSGVSSRQVAMEAKSQKKLAAVTSDVSNHISNHQGPEHRLIQHSAHRFEPHFGTRRADDDADSGIALVKPPMAEKKSVFSIAYADIQRQTRQLRPESSTPT